MALFKILKGSSGDLSYVGKTNGYCYFTTDNQLLYVDYNNPNNSEEILRAPINAVKIYRTAIDENGDLTIDTSSNGATLAFEVNDTHEEIPTSAAVLSKIQTVVNESVPLAHDYVMGVEGNDEVIFSTKPLGDIDNYLFFYNGILLAPGYHYSANNDNTGIVLTWTIESGDMFQIIGPRFAVEDNFVPYGLTARSGDVMDGEVAYGISEAGETSYITGNFSLERELSSQETIVTELGNLL